MTHRISFDELPGEARFAADALKFKTKVGTAWQTYLGATGEPPAPLDIRVGGPAAAGSAGPPTAGSSGGEKATGPTADRAAHYRPTRPLFTFDQLIVSDEVRRQLLLAAELIALEKRVFDDWGLRRIEPFPRAALNFHGPPGTGKSLAAHALASRLGRDILSASYANIESMYHGEGPKNVEAVFRAAHDGGAVLFIDEADSLLSKRLTAVTQGSEQAINSMRSQLLICLERFRGVVVFATNLVTNYDPAFETRVRSIHFPLPDRAARHRIWQVHLPPELPLAADVDVGRLAERDGLCGREIKNAVLEAALQAAAAGADAVSQQDFSAAVMRVEASRIQPAETVHALTAEEQAAVERVIADRDGLG